MINSIIPPGIGIEPTPTVAGSDLKDGRKSVSDAFGKIFDETASNIKAADSAILQSGTGGSVDLHDVMITMEKADISLRLMVQVRNKALDAYQEIMRMQV